MVMMLGASAVGLRSHGFDGRSIFMRALQQPNWWRSWYPRAFRRRGDVWNRLPRELRRFRIYRGAYQTFLLAIFLPLQLTFFLTGHPLPVALNLVLWAIWLVGMALLLAERRRATKFVRAKVGSTAADASAILTAPTWSVSTWRRTPISSLLGGPARTTRHGSEPINTGDSLASERTKQL